MLYWLTLLLGLINLIVSHSSVVPFMSLSAIVGIFRAGRRDGHSMPKCRRHGREEMEYSFMRRLSRRNSIPGWASTSVLMINGWKSGSEWDWIWNAVVVG